MFDHHVAGMDLMKIMFQKGKYPAKCPSKDETKEPKIKYISCSGQLFQNLKRRRKVSIRMCTTRFSDSRGVSLQRPLQKDHGTRDRDHQEENFAHGTRQPKRK